MTAQTSHENKWTTPDRVLDVAFAFRKSKVLLSAVELNLFSTLAETPLDAEALVHCLGLQGRGARDFFDSLVALGLLERDTAGRYSNTPEGARYLDRRQPTYIGGLLDYLNTRQYESWSRLTVALRVGQSQSGPDAAGGFAAFYADASNRDVFVRGMTGGMVLPAEALAARFPWHDFRTFIDIGTGEGCMPVAIARANPHLCGGGFDLPPIEPAFKRYVHEHALSERVRFVAGDFLNDPLPAAEVVIMARVLHDWDLDTRKRLLRKACDALPPGGALIACEAFIDDERRAQTGGLLASLNMLIQTSGGFESTVAECRSWMRESGFAETRTLPLAGAYAAVIGIKRG